MLGKSALLEPDETNPRVLSEGSPLHLVHGDGAMSERGCGANADATSIG